MLKRIVNNGAPDEKTFEAFEASISLTAAISEHLAKGEFIIDLFATGSKTWHFRGGRSLAQLDDLLDILACVEASFDEPFENIDSALLDEIGAIGAVIVMLSEADSKAEEFCRQIRESGAGLRTILVSKDKGPAWTETISPEDIAEGRATRL